MLSFLRPWLVSARRLTIILDELDRSRDNFGHLSILERQRGKGSNSASLIAVPDILQPAQSVNIIRASKVSEELQNARAAWEIAGVHNDHQSECVRKYPEERPQIYRRWLV